ncbi:LON peptidase substrate-binding domain-containing protein [Terrabacter sp. MAHUQ-38]|jgi:Lon protease-like protein|uniref:LON peptidase substrate-binding domain-containing protein n=1 Tax=unclassified Terrabacter TaxID=2630222 RepID=UPI00165E9A4C|nr:LON peptidase substrate-binding domain-containing protein [Terrabacter sp. MAHUQ-38]MBC9820261.1 LON peptidase substrate-binding domain-containing protein [Terrabacter sp. MAHUQ-38]
MAILPLFPLGTVLMPGARLPLQIFEPRYVQLLHDLLDGQDQRSPVFGVVAIREGHEVGEDAVRALHPVGCGALLTQAAALEGERFLVISEGTDRFHLDAIDGDAGTPYATGRVTWLPEPDGDAATIVQVAARLRSELTDFAAATGQEAEIPTDDRALAYAVPDTVSLDVADRQRLLESPDTESRLRLGLQLTQRELEFATALGAVAKPPLPPFSLN